MANAGIHTRGHEGPKRDVNCLHSARRITLLVGEKSYRAELVAETASELVVRADVQGLYHPDRKWLTYEQLADHAGLSVGTLQKLVSRGALPHLATGGRTIFEREAVDEFLADRQRSQRAFEEIAAKGKAAAERILKETGT